MTDDLIPAAQHVPSPLMRESLMDKRLLAETDVMDRGRAALLPLLDEIVACQQAGHTLIIGVGAGVRSRHIFAVGLDLGLPTGVLAALSAKDAAQNAYMVACLLARHGFVYLEAPFLVQLLPAMLAAAHGAVFNGTPPYELWEHPPAVGKLPPHRTDAGAYLVAEVFGVRQTILIKDVDGLYSADPVADPTATFIPRARAADLLAAPLPTLPFDPALLDLLTRARLAPQVQIINGLVPGTLTRALAGEPVGTVLHR